MSEATKRKHVEKELEDELPKLEEGQAVVKVLAPRGNNLHEARWPSGSVHLISMPPKFRKHVYIKRGEANRQFRQHNQQNLPQNSTPRSLTHSLILLAWVRR